VRSQTSQMRLLVTIVAVLMILGLAAFGLVLAQKGLTPTVTTVHIAPATEEVSALPARAPVSQIAQATGSEASPLLLQAHVDGHTGSSATSMQAPSAVATAPPNVKDLSSSNISMAMVRETTRLKDDAAGWSQKLRDLELDLKKNQQDVEATSKDIDECLVAKRRTRASSIARTLKRTEGATRQKAFSLGLSLDSRA
jgi:hypothetical protein